jgi:hypothetical protein
MNRRINAIFNSKKYLLTLIIIWWFSLAGGLFIWLWSNGYIIQINQEITIMPEIIKPSIHGPYSYVLSMGTNRLSQNEAFTSPAVLLEDGQTLSPGNSSHADIGKLGSGRFSYWKGYLYFSSSDNSDPRTNGRIYTLVIPTFAEMGPLIWISLLLFLPLVGLSWQYYRIDKAQLQISSTTLIGGIEFALVASLLCFLGFTQAKLLHYFPSLLVFLLIWGLFIILIYWVQKKYLQKRKKIFTVTNNDEHSTKWYYVIFQFLIKHYLFIICALVLSLVFLITRLPFYYHYPIVGIQYDTETFLNQVSSIQSGNLPLFDHRPPGYILFIWLITSVINRWIVVVGVQSLLFLAASLSLIYGAYCIRRILVVPATIAMVGFLGSSHVLMYETTALSESLYTTCLVFIFAFLLLAFTRNQVRFYVMASLSMILVISIRFAGMFMLVVFLVILIYMLWNKYKPKLILGFLSPMLLILLIWSTYNYFTLEKFSISPLSQYNMGGATLWFWEPDDNFSPAVNNVLRKLPADLKEIGITAADQEILQQSWKSAELFPIFMKLYNPLVKKGWTHERFVDISNDENAESIVGQIISTSVKKHPDLYVKFIWTNLVKFYQILEWGKIDFYNVLLSRLNYFYTDSNGGLYHIPDLRGDVSKEYSNLHTLEFASATISGTESSIILSDSRLKQYHEGLQQLQWKIFHQRIWVIAFFIIFIMSTIKLLLTKGRHLGSFLLFTLSIMVIGASLVTCLSEPALERYAYPTQFIYYLSVALFPLLWIKKENKIHSVEEITTNSNYPQE